MSLPELVVPAVSVAATIGVTLRYGSDAVVRLAAGITAITAKDRDRAERALKVLRALRGDRGQPDDDGPSG